MTSTIESRLLWNHTGIRVDAGARYEIAASGQWIDKKYTAGPEGYVSPNLLMKMFEFRRRVRSANWFALIGALDEDESTQFVIGARNVFTAPRAGELTCFANDWRSKLDNNRGSVTIVVKRLDS